MSIGLPRRRGFAWRTGALLAYFSLILQVGLAAAHEPVGLGFASPLFGAPLCHFSGSGATNHAPSPAAPGQGALCPICLGLAAASSAVLPPDPGSAVLVLDLPSVPVPLRLNDAHPAHALRIAAQPRAPPVLA